MFQHGISTQTHISKRHYPLKINIKIKRILFHDNEEPLSLFVHHARIIIIFYSHELHEKKFLSVKIYKGRLSMSRLNDPSSFYWKNKYSGRSRSYWLKSKMGGPSFYPARGGRPGGDAGHGRGAQDAAARLPRRTGWLLLLRLPTKRQRLSQPLMKYI